MILIVKGTVQRKLTGVESDIERWCSIFTFKGNSLFKLQKTGFSGLSQILWLLHLNRAPTAASQLILEIGLPLFCK
jgi:hypothetical protein